MDLRVIGVLLLVPLLDVMLLVVLATRIGPVPTVAIVVLTAFIGLLLARAEGRHTMGKIQQKLARGEPPTDELLDGGLLLVAGALMLTPGLVTDLIGLILVLPPTRYPIRFATKKYVLMPYAEARTGGFATGSVYVGGFPNRGDDAAGAGGSPGAADPGPGAGPAGSDDDTVEMGEDAYRFTDVEGDAGSGTGDPGSGTGDDSRGSDPSEDSPAVTGDEPDDDAGA
jgi:UPF0716 protein FxsA